MKKTNYLFLVFACFSSIAMAEYRAVVKFPTPEAGFDDKGNPVYRLIDGVDDIDLKACEAIAENIRSMDKLGVNWSCDFPISANSFTLSKPQWTEIFDKDKVDALFILDPNRKGDAASDLPVFSAFYPGGEGLGRESIYAAPYPGYECKPSATDARIGIWFPKEWGVGPLINNDVIAFSSRFYFVRFSINGYRDKDALRGEAPARSFYVTALRNSPNSNNRVVSRVCSVYPAK